MTLPSPSSSTRHTEARHDGRVYSRPAVSALGGVRRAVRQGLGAAYCVVSTSAKEDGVVSCRGRSAYLPSSSSCSLAFDRSCRCLPLLPLLFFLLPPSSYTSPLLGAPLASTALHPKALTSASGKQATRTASPSSSCKLLLPPPQLTSGTAAQAAAPARLTRRTSTPRSTASSSSTSADAASRHPSASSARTRRGTWYRTSRSCGSS